MKRRINSHQKYLEKLDTTLEYLEEDHIKYDDIEEIKESVEYYVDENGEPDFVEDELVFDNLFKKAKEAEQYDDFEDIEDEVIMEGNVIQALPANAEPVAVNKTEEADVLKLVDDNAAKLREKQEKERLERERLEKLERERQEELDRQRLEQERIEKAAAAAAASALAAKKSSTNVQASPKTTTAAANKQAAKQQQKTAATKNTTATTTAATTAATTTTSASTATTPVVKVQPTPVVPPIKKITPTPELNFVAAAAQQVSPTKTITRSQTPTTPITITTTTAATTILPKSSTSSAAKSPLTVKPNVSYIEAINAGTPTTSPITIMPQGVSSSGSRGVTPRSGTNTPPLPSASNEPIMNILRNDMPDITIQTVPSSTTTTAGGVKQQQQQPQVIMSKDKKQPVTPTTMMSNQQLQQQQAFMVEDQTNEETFGSMSAVDMGSLEHMASRTQEMNQNFIGGIPVVSSMQQQPMQQQQQQQHPMMTGNVVAPNVGMPHMHHLHPSHLDQSQLVPGMQMGQMGQMAGQMGQMGQQMVSGMMGASMPVGAGFSQSPPPTMVPSSMPSTPAATMSTTLPKSSMDLFYDIKNELLQASLNHLPHPGDCERPRQYTPVNPFDTPSFFPQEQLPMFKDSAVYSMMDPDTLFFIFYYQQGTYQQYLAAKALKKHAWRYHKKYQTWFQRHDPPTHTTNEFELGTYVYFDYEQDWCQRIKSGFRFEYEYLEDAIL